MFNLKSTELIYQTKYYIVPLYVFYGDQIQPTRYKTLYQVYRHPSVSEILRSCTFHGLTLFLSPFYSVNVCLLFVNKKLSPFDQIRVGGCFYDFSILIWNCSDDVVFFVCHVNIWQINYNCNRIVGICNTIHLRNCMLFRLYLEKSLVPMAKNVRRMQFCFVEKCRQISQGNKI